jgi:hypothetical protein
VSFFYGLETEKQRDIQLRPNKVEDELDSGFGELPSPLQKDRPQGPHRREGLLACWNAELEWEAPGLSHTSNILSAKPLRILGLSSYLSFLTCKTEMESLLSQDYC